MLWFIVTEGKNRSAEEFVYLTTAIHSFYSTDSSTRCITETVSLLLFVFINVTEVIVLCGLFVTFAESVDENPNHNGSESWINTVCRQKVILE